tara:strand:+ start:508 stop:801 length:294 start_codon:yes stop_codon:yes gene_type:complete
MKKGKKNKIRIETLWILCLLLVFMLIMIIHNGVVLDDDLEGELGSVGLISEDGTFNSISEIDSGHMIYYSLVAILLCGIFCVIFLLIKVKNSGGLIE